MSKSCKSDDLCERFMVTFEQLTTALNKRMKKAAIKQSTRSIMRGKIWRKAEWIWRKNEGLSRLSWAWDGKLWSGERKKKHSKDMDG